MSDSQKHPWFTVGIESNGTLIIIEQQSAPTKRALLDTTLDKFFMIQAPDSVTAGEIAKVLFDKQK